MTYASAPLSSSAFFTPSLFAFNTASKALSDSTLKLSSGSRLIRAGEDVASLSVATRMQSQLVGLRQASSNAVQGDSLLQVAQSGLDQIMDLLDRMDALAAQSNSASLSNTDRTYLQAEFASYIEEIDRIANNTAFNNINLLDGNLSGEGTPTYTSTPSTKASANLLFGDALTAGETVILNGATFVANTDFTIGGSAALTVENLKTALNNSTNAALSKATYSRSGDMLIITADAGGSAGNQYTVNLASSTANFTVTSGDTTQLANFYTLTGGDDDGLSMGSAKVTGMIGDTLVNTQSQTKGSVTLNLTGNASNGELLRIENGNGSYLNFTFATVAATDTDIQIGSSIEETLQNVIDTVSQYADTSDYVTRQLDFEIDGDSLIIRNKVNGNPTDFAGNAPDITETITNGTLSAATITGGTNTGVNVDGVTNSEFIGEITGFSATYVGADSITASITVGDSTYTASITDTTPASNTTVRFTSTNGGYFDVQLAASQGQAVTNQTTADSYAQRLNAAFEGLTFHQNLPISNFEATGNFIGASASLQLDDFTDVRFDSVEVTAPVGDDATIDITINGEIFRASSGIGGTLGAYESLKFTSIEDSNRTFTLNNGSTVQDFSDTAEAADFEDDLRGALGLDETGSGVSFQVGVESTDRVNVVVNKATTEALFNGQTPDISTQSNAGDAQDIIETARQSVLANIAQVGSLQARFESVQNVNSKIIEGVMTANSNLADTDIAEESTNYALAALKVNSGVAIIAQTRQLQSGLLTLLQTGLNG